MFCSQPKQNVNPTLHATLPKQNTLKLPQSNVGFINLGNTCYANSMLQALSILPELWNQFPSEIGCTPPLLNRFLIIMTWLKRHKTSIDPSGFLHALSSKMSLIHNHPFNFNTQQDVPKILQVLLDEITGTSVLANNFLKTTIRTSISCTSCLCDSENEESVSILQVPTENTISKSIQTLLKVTFAPLPTFGNHHKIYNNYKLYLKTDKF